MFIREKKSKGTSYYQVVRSRRDAGKVVQDVVVALGQCRTISAAISVSDQELCDARDALNREFGDDVPSDLNDDIAVGTTADKMPKTVARRFRQRIKTVLRLTEKIAHLREVETELEDTSPSANPDVAEMKKKSPLWGTW
ncbi:hypothetical protein [Paramagnetospirillum magnetotacticum]|uniref:hypothetical protein n=1 Tax=Paramagnetospirillum magnetotacticum TaxID=188 RepID=UPI0005973ACB|nr:hypothetical protein [Paramagnetospirillum magnetotacticum]